MMKAKLHRIRVDPKPGKSGHVRVSGILDVEGHHLPFGIRLHPRHDAKHLEKRLEEHHAKGLLWAKIRPHYNRWQGKETHAGVEIDVLFCEIGAHGPHDWRLTVIWDETVDGRKEHHTKVVRRDSPAGLPSIETLKETIRNGVEARKTNREAASPHVEVVLALKAEMMERKAGERGKPR